MAYGNDIFLSVWREGWEGKNGGARIRAARVSIAGKLLDATSFELAPNSDRDAPQEYPRVAFCHDTFLVVWHDLRNGTDYDVLAARVSLAGKVLDASPISVAVGSHNQALPDVAADDSGFLVVWQGYEPTSRTFRGYASRVSLKGEVESRQELNVAPNLRVAWNGANFLATCGSAGALESGLAQRLNRNGEPLSKDRPTLIAPRVETYSLSAVPGRGWVVVTHRNKPNPWGWGGPGAMRSFFLDSSGALDTSMPKEEGYPRYELQPNWLDNATNDRERWPYGPSASAWDGRQTVVMWTRFQCTGEKKSTLSNGNIMVTRTTGWQRQSDDAIAVASTDADELNPTLASNAAGRLLCVYEKEIGPKVILCAKTLRSE